MTPFIAEIIGTFLLIFLGCSVNANVSLNKTYGLGSGWIVITTAWALAVSVAVVVTGSSSRNAAVRDEIYSILGEAAVYYNNVTPDPILSDVDGLVESLRETEVDCVIAVGGGSVIAEVVGRGWYGYGSPTIVQGDYASGNAQRLDLVGTVIVVVGYTDRTPAIA